MTGVLAGRGLGGVAVCLSLLVGACGAAGPSSSTGGKTSPSGGGGGDSAPANDTFTGSIVSGSGTYAGHHGSVTIYLHPHGLVQARAVRVAIRGRCGGSSQGCTDLSGSLTGRLIRSGGHLPDTGSHYSLTGRGRVIPLGDVMAAGAVQGTGFISRGQELIQITLTAASGSVTFRATSGPVKGFTSP
jgi:hypothetical protein